MKLKNGNAQTESLLPTTVKILPIRTHSNASSLASGKFAGNVAADLAEDDEDGLGYTHTLMYGRYTKDLGEFAKDEARKLKLLEKRRKQEDKQRNKELLGKRSSRLLKVSSWVWKRTFARLGEDWVFLALLGIIMALLSYIMDKGISICTNARVWLYRDLTSQPITQYIAWVSLPVCLILFSAGFVHLIAPQSIAQFASPVNGRNAAALNVQLLQLNETDNNQNNDQQPLSKANAYKMAPNLVREDSTASAAAAAAEKNGKNLTALTWAHAVNSQHELEDALNSDIDFIEADIVLGKLNNVGADLPVMAHPPATTSDITLEEFLQRIAKHNAEHAEQMKGVKLDFKSIEVFEGSLSILDEVAPTMTYPLWLNADIVRGPVNQTNTLPVDADRFFVGSARYKKAVLSIGWTTRWSSDYNEGAYERNEIDEMLAAIERNNVRETAQPITFPVRAGIAANSGEQLHELVQAVNKTNECSLTIWSSANDYVHVEKLRELILSFGVHRVYLDVPADLSSKLDLGRNNGAPFTFMPLLNFSLVAGCVVLASFWLQRPQL